ncbi:MAG: hypothetical protein RL716_1267 [Actinomycetota bacterium]
MVRRVRRIRYRAEIAARLDAEQATVTSEKPAATVKKAATKPARPAAPAKPKRD